MKYTSLSSLNNHLGSIRKFSSSPDVLQNYLRDVRVVDLRVMREFTLNVEDRSMKEVKNVITETLNLNIGPSLCPKTGDVENLDFTLITVNVTVYFPNSSKKLNFSKKQVSGVFSLEELHNAHNKKYVHKTYVDWASANRRQKPCKIRIYIKFAEK